MKIDIYSGYLYDMKMDVYTNDHFLTIELAVNGVFVSSFVDVSDLCGYFNKYFSYLSSIDPDYKKPIGDFVNNFFHLCKTKRSIEKFFVKNYNSIKSFAYHFNTLGTLDIESFDIGDYTISFKEQNEMRVTFLSHQEIEDIKRIAILNNHITYSLWENVYFVLHLNLVKLFKNISLSNLTEVNYKYITIAKK